MQDCLDAAQAENTAMVCESALQLVQVCSSLGLVDIYEATIAYAVIGNARMAVLRADKAADISSHCLGDDQNSLGNDLSILKQLRSAAESDNPFNLTQIQWSSQWL